MATPKRSIPKKPEFSKPKEKAEKPEKVEKPKPKPRVEEEEAEFLPATGSVC